MLWPTAWILFIWIIKVVFPARLPTSERFSPDPIPPVLPICSNEVVSNSAPSIPIYHYRKPIHIGVLPAAGNFAQLVLSENGIIPTPQPSTTLPPNLIQVEDYHDISIPTLTPLYCSIKLEACASCTISLEYLPPRKYFDGKNGLQIANCENVSNVPCFNLEVLEERSDHGIPVKSSVINEVYSRTSIWTLFSRNQINSTGNSLTIVATFRNIDNKIQLTEYLSKLFPMKALVVDNTQITTGLSEDLIFFGNQTSVGFIESPRYPDSYPQNIVKNYTLVNLNKKGYVRLVFDDFHVHYQSEIQIIDSDGKELFNTRSEYRRPPAFVSKANTLTVIFSGRGFTQLIGFRAQYEFVESALWSDKPTRRNCDENLDGYGGVISLNNQKLLNNKHIDCIWLIGRFPALSRTFDKIYLKVEEFKLNGDALMLEVRRGPSSTSERVLMLYEKQLHTILEKKQPLKGFMTEDSNQPAFYVRLRGHLMYNAGLSIVYTQFYRWATGLCPGGDSEFYCDNNKCINSSLQCDGFDHCGDSSDEVCHVESTVYDDTPHVDIAGAVTLIIGAVGVIVLLLTIVAVMSKLYRKRFLNQVRGRSGHTRSANIINAAGNTVTTEAYCNELAPTIQTIGDRRFYVLPESQISIIEAPPTYDDALKHPAVPVLSSRQRARSSMAFVYVNDGYSSEGMASTATSPERRATAPVEEPIKCVDSNQHPQRIKRRLTKTCTDTTTNLQQFEPSSTNPREPTESCSPPPVPMSLPPELDDQPGPSRPASSRETQDANGTNEDDQSSESWV